MDRSKIVPVLAAFILLSISCASCQPSDILAQFMAMTNVKEGNHSHYQSISFENKNIAEKMWDRWSFFDMFTTTLTALNHPSLLYRRMEFEFPFNGKMGRDVYVHSDGYLQFGKKPYDNLNQFIAPFMYRFKRISKRLRIFIRSTTSYFSVQYNNMEFPDSTYVSGKMSFQVTLYREGLISFVYKKCPDLSSLEGQNAYLYIGTRASERYVDPYNETRTYQNNLADFYEIRNYTVIFLRPVKWCPTYSDCDSCVSNKWGLPCKWCAEAQHCIDGFDSDNVEWKSYQCDNSAVNSSEQCDVPLESR